MLEETKKKAEDIYTDMGKQLMEVFLSRDKGEPLALAVYAARLVLLLDRNAVIDLMIEEIEGAIQDMDWKRVPYTPFKEEVVASEAKAKARDEIIKILKSFKYYT